VGERDRRTLRTVSRNYRTTATQLNIHLEDPDSTKLSDVSFTNPKFKVGLQLLNLCLLKVILRCVYDGVTVIKPGRQTTRRLETRS
jgi:hypothetical protein